MEPVVHSDTRCGMATLTDEMFEKMLRAAGQGWYLDINKSFGLDDKATALATLRKTLHKTDERAQERLGSNAPRLTPEVLHEMFQSNALKLKVVGFLESLTVTANPDILVMVWRIEEGWDIAEVRLDYELLTRFNLYVRLRSPRGLSPSRPDEEYESSDIKDAGIMQRFGRTKRNDRPVFDGYVARSFSWEDGSK